MRILPVIAAVAMGSACFGQTVISAKSGLIHYVEGEAYNNGKPVEHKNSRFDEIKTGSEFKTFEGRAEILLSPGVFLRVGESSAFTLTANKLDSTRFQLTKGSVLLEVADVLSGNVVNVDIGKTSTEVRKNGLYRFDVDPGTLRVYKGEAIVSVRDAKTTVKDGKTATLDTDAVVLAKFDKEVTDSLYRWSSRRASYMALANVASARSLEKNGMSWASSGWQFNPYFGMFTYIPGAGFYNSPFGYRFWSPAQVYQVYYRPPVQAFSNSGYSRGSYYDSNLGYNVGSRGSMASGNMGGMSGAPAASAGAVSSGDGGMRGGGGAAAGGGGGGTRGGGGNGR